MKFIQGHNRDQITLFPVSLEQSIDPDNEVRLIDLFVDSLSIKDYGFRTDFPENGRPAYYPSDMLKLFIYGYMNKVRSTRDLEKRLKESGESQISLSDPESKQIAIRNNITEVAYNVQTTVNAKNNIPIDYKVINDNDSKAMGNMVQRAKSILRINEFTALYDKGFHTGSELKIVQNLGIETIVAIPSPPSTSQAPIMLIIMRTSNTKKKTIPTYVLRDKSSSLPEHGTRKEQVAGTSYGSSSTKQRLANDVLSFQSARNPKREEWYKEMSTQIIMRETGSI